MESDLCEVIDENLDLIHAKQAGLRGFVAYANTYGPMFGTYFRHKRGCDQYHKHVRYGQPRDGVATFWVDWTQEGVVVDWEPRQ